MKIHRIAYAMIRLAATSNNSIIIGHTVGPGEAASEHGRIQGRGNDRLDGERDKPPTVLCLN